SGHAAVHARGPATDRPAERLPAAAPVPADRPAVGPVDGPGAEPRRGGAGDGRPHAAGEPGQVGPSPLPSSTNRPRRPARSLPGAHPPETVPSGRFTSAQARGRAVCAPALQPMQGASTADVRDVLIDAGGVSVKGGRCGRQKASGALNCRSTTEEAKPRAMV